MHYRLIRFEPGGAWWVHEVTAQGERYLEAKVWREGKRWRWISDRGRYGAAETVEEAIDQATEPMP